MQTVTDCSHGSFRNRANLPVSGESTASTIVERKETQKQYDPKGGRSRLGATLIMPSRGHRALVCRKYQVKSLMPCLVEKSFALALQAQESIGANSPNFEPE